MESAIHTVAVPAAAPLGPEPQAPDLLDLQRWGVQAAEVWGGGQAVGSAQEQDQHELWQAQQSPALLLRQGKIRVGIRTRDLFLVRRYQR